MSGNKIEFKIVRDSSGKHVDLTNMSMMSTKSLLTLLTSLTNILEEFTDGKNVKIQIVKGSATLVAEAPETVIREVQNGFNEVIENKSANKQLVENWQSIQSLIQGNGLEYEANFYTGSVKVPIIERIKSSKKFRVRTKRRKVGNETDLIFITGKLIEVGGKKPNIHIIQVSDEKYTVACNESQAIKVNKFLYKDVQLSIWRTKKTNGVILYSFCDFYIDEPTYNDYANFITSLYQKNEVDALLELHQILRKYIERKDHGKLKKLLRLFNHESLDVSTLKTILVVTKSLKDNFEIAELRKSLKGILETKIGTLV